MNMKRVCVYVNDHKIKIKMHLEFIGLASLCIIELYYLINRKKAVALEARFAPGDVHLS